MPETKEDGTYSWCLMLVRLNDQMRANPAEAYRLVREIRGQYMSHFKTPPDSTPMDECEGALCGEYDFYALFKYNSEGPVWLATRLQQSGAFSKVLAMQAIPLPKFGALFAR